MIKDICCILNNFSGVYPRVFGEKLNPWNFPSNRNVFSIDEPFGSHLNLCWEMIWQRLRKGYHVIRVLGLWAGQGDGSWVQSHAVNNSTSQTYTMKHQYKFYIEAQCSLLVGELFGVPGGGSHLIPWRVGTEALHLGPFQTSSYMSLHLAGPHSYPLS